MDIFTILCLEPLQISLCFASKIGNRCRDILKHVQAYMEIKYRKQKQSLYNCSVRVSIWYLATFIFHHCLNSLWHLSYNFFK